MASITRLSLTATPGKVYSFVAKTEAVAEAGPHTGLFTELSLIGTPGKIHSFTAKAEAEVEASDHTGLFTALSVLATPGMIHSFAAKAEAEVIPETDKWADHDEGGWVNPMEYQEGLFAAEEYQRMLVLKDDDEVLSIIANIITSGIL